MYCKKCGVEIEEGKTLCENCEKTTKSVSGIRYVSIILAALVSVLPFLTWIKVPVAQGLHSLLGMKNNKLLMKKAFGSKM